MRCKRRTDITRMPFSRDGCKLISQKVRNKRLIIKAKTTISTISFIISAVIPASSPAMVNPVSFAFGDGFDFGGESA